MFSAFTQRNQKNAAKKANPTPSTGGKSTNPSQRNQKSSLTKLAGKESAAAAAPKATLTIKEITKQNQEKKAQEKRENRKLKEEHKSGDKNEERQGHAVPTGRKQENETSQKDLKAQAEEFDTAAPQSPQAADATEEEKPEKPVFTMEEYNKKIADTLVATQETRKVDNSNFKGMASTTRKGDQGDDGWGKIESKKPKQAAKKPAKAFKSGRDKGSDVTKDLCNFSTPKPEGDDRRGRGGRGGRGCRGGRGRGGYSNDAAKPDEETPAEETPAEETAEAAKEE